MNCQYVVNLVLIDSVSLIFKKFVVQERELESLEELEYDNIEHGLLKVALPRGVQVDGSKLNFRLEKNEAGEVL